MAPNGKEKIVSLCEDRNYHEHDEKSFQKLYKGQQKVVHKPKRNSKQNFSHAVKTGMYQDEE